MSELILFGGTDSGVNGETWSWDGATWTELSPAASPSARYYARSIWDSGQRRHVLFGGSDDGDETWEFDGTDWVQLTPATTPPTRYEHAFAYDIANAKGVIFDGFNGTDTPGLRVEDQYLWDGTDWTLVTPTSPPDYRRYAAFGYDDNTSLSVLFSGTQIVDAADTWTWDGAAWTEVTTAHAPNSAGFGLHAASLAYDPISNLLLLAGGNRGTDLTTFATWTWDGSDWTELSPAHSPSERSDGNMALCPNLGQLVYFGGNNRFGTKFDETWTWDGSDWTEVTPGTSPSARIGPALAPFLTSSVSLAAVFGRAV